MIRGLPTTILSACLAGAVGIGLFFIKHEVKEQEARLSELNREVLRNQEVIHVLKAEWSYLNDPARLRTLSEKFLGMKVMGSSQIVTLNTLPVAGVMVAGARPAAATPHPQAKVAAAPAPQPLFVAPPVKLAQSPQPAGPARTIVIPSPALASTPALPGEVR